MRLVWQWVTLERDLPPDWSDVQLVLKVRERDVAEAAALLGGANPLRGKDSIRLFVSRTGGLGPEALKRALLRLDRKDIAGTLELTGVEEAERPPEEERRTLAQQWDEAVATLPPDWSDMLAEVGLRSSDYLEYAALLIAPANPTRPGRALVLQFRAARRSATAWSPGWRGVVSNGSTRKRSAASSGVARALRPDASRRRPVWRVGGGAVSAGPVSWMVIEQGWSVVDSEGDDVGRIDEVLGDEEADIFNGLNILKGAIGTKTYVPAEVVGEIVEGRVQLTLTKDDV
jgi:hypothetical protein